jgi:multidrug resistance efflux pump
LALAVDPLKPPATTPETAKVPTCKVEKGRIHTDVTVKGVFESEDMHEIAIHPKATGAGQAPVVLTVIKAVPHGTAVKKGDLLVELDLEKIDEAIKDRRTERSTAEVALREAEEELPVQEKSLPIEQAAAERAKREAEEDMARFKAVDRSLAEQTADEILKGAQYQLEAAREELKQLEKMYRAKDLTEETEEYILKRQRQQVKQAEFSLKSATISREQTLKVDMPRREIGLRENTVKTALALEKARNSSPLVLRQKKLALQKMKADFERSGEQLSRLEQDREAMTVRAPADGIVFYGRLSDGQWPAASTLEARLRRGGVLAPEEVFMTVVSARPLVVQATVEEKDVYVLKPNLAGKATPAGYPKIKLPVRVIKVSTVPQSPGKFEALLTVDLGKEGEAVMPGMACEAKFTAYHKDDALTVPATAVFAVEGEEDSHYVYLAHGEEKRTVKVGETSGQKTEILEGLKAGDEILTAKPQGKP